MSFINEISFNIALRGKKPRKYSAVTHNSRNITRQASTTTTITIILILIIPADTGSMIWKTPRNNSTASSANICYNMTFMARCSS